MKAMTDEQWRELFPEGFRPSVTIRRFPNTVWKNLHRIATELEVSWNYALVMCLAEGIQHVLGQLAERGEI